MVGHAPALHNKTVLRWRLSSHARLGDGTYRPAFETAANGDVVLAFKLAQSGVDANFRMLVPIYLEQVNGQVIRLSSARPIDDMTVDQKRFHWRV